LGQYLYDRPVQPHQQRYVQRRQTTATHDPSAIGGVSTQSDPIEETDSHQTATNKTTTNATEHTHTGPHTEHETRPENGNRRSHSGNARATADRSSDTQDSAPAIAVTRNRTQTLHRSAERRSTRSGANDDGNGDRGA